MDVESSRARDARPRLTAGERLPGFCPALTAGTQAPCAHQHFSLFFAQWEGNSC